MSIRGINIQSGTDDGLITGSSSSSFSRVNCSINLSKVSSGSIIIFKTDKIQKYNNNTQAIFGVFVVLKIKTKEII